MRDSLQMAGVIRPKGQTWKALCDADVFTVGDLGDRGRETLQVYERLLELMHDTHIRWRGVAGNHELFMEQALREYDPAYARADGSPPDPTAVASWMVNGGVEVLAEICTKFRLFLRGHVRDNDPVNFRPGGEETEAWKMWKETREERPYLDTYDLPAAYVRAQQLFLHGRYKPVLDALDMFILDQGCAVVHASVNDESVCRLVDHLGPAGVNEWYRAERAQNNLRLFQTPQHRDPFVLRVKPGEIEPVTKEQARVYRARGIRAVLYGHTICGSGTAEWITLHGLTFVNADVGMNKWRDFGPNPGYVKIGLDDTMTAESVISHGVRTIMHMGV